MKIFQKLILGASVYYATFIIVIIIHVYVRIEVDWNKDSFYF